MVGILARAAHAQTTPPNAPAPHHHHVVDSGDSQDDSSSDPASKQVSWNDAHTIDIQGFTNPAAGWSLTPDGPKRLKVQTDIELHGKTADFNEKPKAIFVARQAPWAFVTYVKGGNPPTLRIEVIDLTAGKSTGVVDIKEKSNLVDVSPDGKALLLMGDDKHSRLEIWTVDAAGSAATRTAVFFPFESDDRGKDVDHAMFTDAGHVAAVSTGEKLAVFDVAKMSAVWSATIERGYPTLLSPGGKYLLVRTRDAHFKYREPTVISAETGQPIGMLDPGAVADDPPLSFHSVAAFTPSGGKIAMIDDHNVRVWDLTAGKPSDLFGLPLGSKIWMRPTMAFTSETAAVLGVDGLMLIDFDRRIPLWQYKLLRDSVTKVAADGRCWFTFQDASTKGYFLDAVDLPDAKATAAAHDLAPSSLLALYPGAKVSLKIDVPGSPEIQAKIKDEITKKLSALKIDVVDGQPLEVRAVIEEGPPQEAVYVRQGRPFNEGQRVRYTVKQSKIILQDGGDVYWQTFRWDQPGKKVQLEPGESIQAAINRVSQPDYDFFARAEIPQHVAKTHNPLVFGTSTLEPAD